MTPIEAFLIGVIATASFAAGLFFLRYWRDTRDSFFLLFSASFILEGCNRIVTLYLERPNEAHSAIYVVRLAAFLLILLAIARKNYGSSRSKSGN